MNWQTLKKKLHCTGNFSFDILKLEKFKIHPFLNKCKTVMPFGLFCAKQ